MEINYCLQGKQFTISLSEIQEQIIIQMLGIKVDCQKGSYKTFTDEALQQLFKIRENPLSLKQMELETMIERFLKGEYI